MFENCGSCFAAEQFVDIKLGAKYLLTLTSFISQHVIYNFIYFDMPFVLGGCRLFPGSGIPFSRFCFLACRLYLEVVGFFPDSASFFLDFAFCMPFVLGGCRFFPGSGILFSRFCFFACRLYLGGVGFFSASASLFPLFCFFTCRLRLGVVGFFPIPASFFLDFAFLHAVCT